MKNNKMFFIDLIIAILCSFKLINYSLINIFSKLDGGYLNSLFLICVIIYFMIKFIDVLKNKGTVNKKIKVSIVALLLVCYTTLIFLININKSNLTIVEFICYYLFPLFMGIYEDINFEKILKYIMLLSLLPLICFDKLFVIYWYGSVNMDISYAFLPTICAAIIHYVYYRKETKNKVLKYTLYLINLFYIWQILLYGERGTLVCIANLLILCFAFKQNDKGKILFDKSTTIKLIIIGILMFNFIVFYHDIINLFVKITGINSYAINKFSLLSNTDISNGRFNLYVKAIDGFLKHPLFGNGISTFNYYYNGTGYPHNIILQLLFDGGIMLFSIFIYILSFGIIRNFKMKEKGSILVLFFFFSIAILYLSFSNDIWVLPSLWFFMGFLIKMPSILKEENNNENFNRQL